MVNATRIGLDVHMQSIKGAALNVSTGEIETRSFRNDPAELASWIKGFEDPKAVYESGVTGFYLQRILESYGVDCVVAAPSKIIRPLADRRKKNDKRDAALLARLLAQGAITEVHVPDPECEASRDLSRTLADARKEVKGCKHRLSKLLLRHGYRYEAGALWTSAHWEWIESIEMSEPAAQYALDARIENCKHAIDFSKGI